MKFFSFHAARLPVRTAAWILGAAIMAAPGLGSADTISLSWTATGDDGTSGRAALYDLRFSDQPVTNGDTLGWWNASSTQAAGLLPAPANSGTRQTYNTKITK